MKISSAILIGTIFHASISHSSTTAEKLNFLDLEMTPIEFIQKLGYQAEEHNLTTEDGYKLTVHRIPGKPGSTPVFLQHGILLSSFEWLIAGKENGLGFVLADHGYDVWLGNARGNAYSRSHVKLDITDQQFWDFSWHEMGIYDLPAVISYITNIKNESLIYVGHSMGTTMFFVMASEKPEMATKVKAMFALAPVTFFRFSDNPLNVLHFIIDSFESFLKSFRLYEILPPDLRKLVTDYAKENCFKSELLNKKTICAQIIIALAEADSSRLDYKIVPLLASHMIKGSSSKTGLHYLQHIDDVLHFKKYNYGTAKNLEIYNSYKPPEYNLSNIQVPVGIFWAKKDTYFAHPLDVKKLHSLLPNKILYYEVPNPDYTHIDFAIGIDSSKNVYPKLLSVMEDYR